MIRVQCILFGFVAATAFALIGLTTDAAERSSDARFLAGLRERGLFELAETYCVENLDAPDLSEIRRAELTIELSLSLADRAVNSPPDRRSPLWQRAWEVTEQFGQQYPQNPRLPLVRFQGTLALVAQGELARQESELVAANQPLVEDTRSLLREAIGQLEKLADEVNRQLQSAGTSIPSAVERTDPERFYQLVALHKNVRYQLARALRNQGQSYASQSADRANSLTRALTVLDRLAKLDVAQPLAFESRLDEILCYRLLDDETTAERKLDALATQNPPPAIVLRARAERIQLALQAGQLDPAIGLADQARTLGGVGSPEFDYAGLQTYLEAWRAAGRTNNAQASTLWQAKATKRVELIEQIHGPYWARRAEMLLAGYVRTSSDGGGLDMQVRAAESSYRSGRPDDALVAYDRARAMAQKQGNVARAFELGYTAAAIEHQRNRHARALDRFRALARGHTRHEQAPQAHLLAIYHAEQIVRVETVGTSEAPDVLDGYVTLLHEHLTIWPTGPTANQARWYLGRFREHQRDWQNALAAYRAITPEFDQFDAVMEAAARCYHAWIADRSAAGQPADSIAANAAGWFESLATDPAGQLPAVWTSRARVALLEAADLWLNHTPSGHARAERLLAPALASTDDTTPEWKSSARAMLVFALAGQGRRTEAAEALRQISDGSPGSPEELFGMIEGLLLAADHANSTAKAGWAELAFQSIELLERRRADVSPDDRRTLNRLKAKTLVHAGRDDEALAAYRLLVKDDPRDGDLQEAYARLLSRWQDRESLLAAMAAWRALEKGARSENARWFRAKYEIALLHYRLGNREQAEKMIKLLAVLYPELGGPEMKGRFLELADLAAKP